MNLMQPLSQCQSYFVLNTINECKSQKTTSKLYQFSLFICRLSVLDFECFQKQDKTRRVQTHFNPKMLVMIIEIAKRKTNGQPNYTERQTGNHFGYFAHLKM